MIADRLRALVAELRTPRLIDDGVAFMSERDTDIADRLDQILAEDAGGWRSMDSAPKDGTRFLWCSYNETGRLQWFYSVIRWPEFKECFTEGWWRPLPEPPPQGATLRWRPFSERPDAMNMPGRQFIFVEGWKEHSGVTWHRCGWGLAGTDATGPHGYSQRSIRRIMEDLDMDGIDAVTHWMPAALPPIQARAALAAAQEG